MLPAFLSLQERVRQFNLGTPTPMHVGTHELVNDLWKANADMLAALGPLAMAARKQAELFRFQARDSTSGVARTLIETAQRWEKLHDDAEAAIAAAVGDTAPKNSEPA